MLCAAEDMPGILTDDWEPCQAAGRRGAPAVVRNAGGKGAGQLGTVP